MRLNFLMGLFLLPTLASGCGTNQTWTNSVGMEFRLIPAGKFIMGAPVNVPVKKEDTQAAPEPTLRQNNIPQHEVTISRFFYLGTYPVTQEEYMRVMGNNPSLYKGPRRPVGGVSWHDAQNFCEKLTAKEHQSGKLPLEETYRLPTEAEWEYACRAGTTTKYYWGETPTREENEASVWLEEGDRKAHIVGEKPPNPWGLYDMVGSVRQWCLDYYSLQYDAGPATDPAGPATAICRVLRGGTWQGEDTFSSENGFWPCGEHASSFRSRGLSIDKGNCLGFRIVRGKVPQVKVKPAAETTEE